MPCVAASLPGDRIEHVFDSHAGTTWAALVALRGIAIIKLLAIGVLPLAIAVSPLAIGVSPLAIAVSPLAVGLSPLAFAVFF